MVWPVCSSQLGKSPVSWDDGSADTELPVFCDLLWTWTCVETRVEIGRGVGKGCRANMRDRRPRWNGCIIDGGKSADIGVGVERGIRVWGVSLTSVVGMLINAC